MGHRHGTTTMGRPMNERGAGLTGVIKLFVGLAVLVIGGMAIAFIFDVLPRDLLQDLTIKVVASTVIALIVAMAIALLSRSR
jgi:hypothetical protein